MVRSARFYSHLPLTGLASLVFFLSAPQGIAATFVSNLANSVADTNIVGDFNTSLANGGIYARLAQKFTAGASTVLGSATLLMAAGGTNTDQFRVDIYSNNAGNPGTPLAQLSGPGNPAAGENTWTGTVPVTSGTSYWIVTSVTAFPNPNSAVGQKKFWSYTDSLSETGDSGWSIADQLKFSSNNGLSWDLFDGSAQMLSLGSVDVAPEPTRAALFMIGLAGMVMRRRRAA